MVLFSYQELVLEVVVFLCYLVVIGELSLKITGQLRDQRTIVHVE